MDAYIFQSALLCEDCARTVRRESHTAIVAQADADDNSDLAPIGPYPNGGGEADSPQHCDHCGIHLQNPLTSEGYNFMQEAAQNPTSHSDVIREWIRFYG